MTDLEELLRRDMRDVTADVHAAPALLVAAGARGRRAVRRRRVRRLAMPALLTVATTIAFANGSLRGHKGETLAPAQTPVTQQQGPDLVRQLLAAGRSDDTHLTVAWRSLADDCIRAKGVQVPELPAAVASRPGLWEQPLPDGYGFSEPAAAGPPASAFPSNWQALMYGDPPLTVTLTSDDQPGGIVQAPVGGCWGQAAAQLYGVPAEVYERTRYAVLHLPDQVAQAAKTDPAVRRATERWSDCMSRLNWSISTPDDLDNALPSSLRSAAERGDRQPLAAKERELASADTTCKTTSDLPTIYNQALTRAGTPLVAPRQQQVRAYLALVSQAERSPRGGS